MLEYKTISENHETFRDDLLRAINNGRPEDRQYIAERFAADPLVQKFLTGIQPGDLLRESLWYGGPLAMALDYEIVRNGEVIARFPWMRA